MKRIVFAMILCAPAAAFAQAPVRAPAAPAGGVQGGGGTGATKAHADGAMPAAGGTATGPVTTTRLTNKYFQAGTTSYNYAGAMTAGTLPFYSNVYLTGTPLAGPSGQIAPWEFLLTDSASNLSAFPAGVDALHVKASLAAGATGSLQAIVGQVIQNGVPAPASYTNGYVAGQFLATGNFNNGGRPGAFAKHHGALFGDNPQVIAYRGATGFALVNAQENDVAVEVSAADAPAEKYGQTIVQTRGDAVRGVYGDAALAIADQAAAGTTWLHGLQFGTVQGKWAFGTDSTLIGALLQAQGCGGSCPSVLPVARYGVDLSAVAFAPGGGAFKSSGFLVDPGGSVSARGLTLPQTTPARSSAPCTVGAIYADANYIYACTAANTWKRAALSAF